MKKLKKYKLDFNLAWIYLENNLQRSNTLSDEVLNKINFENGSFFTLLPIDARLDTIYNFECGGILTQNPIQEYIMAETNTHVKIGSYSIIPNIRKDLSEFILNEMQANRVCCIFDDVNRRAKDKHSPDPYSIRRLIYGDEVYYFLENIKVSTS